MFSPHEEALMLTCLETKLAANIFSQKAEKNPFDLWLKECFREKRYQSVTGLIGVNCFMP
jgi:hypothetical protein